jgi:MHS family proline/betaine transporter-like MFS transporter
MNAFKFAPYQLLKIFGLTCMSSSFYYVFFGYMPTYLENYLGFSLKNSLGIQSGLLFAMLFMVPLAGICGDYLSRKKMLIITAIATMIFAIPSFYLLQMQSFVVTLLVLSIASILSSMDQGNTLTAVVENCPDNVRYSGISFSYNLGMALFGGTTPLIVTLLIEKVNLVSPSYYLIFMAGITVITATTLLKNNQLLGSLNHLESNKKYEISI